MCVKADVDSAFRRIPIKPEHRWACGIAFRAGGKVGSDFFIIICACMRLVQVYMSTHKACMFGAVASVHAWERIGAAICFLARRFLRIAALRYVDDFFAPER